MATRKQKIKVGLFLVGCFLLIAAGITVVSGLYEQQGTSYSVEFDESVLGLGEGGIVEYLGVPVGKVSRIYVTPQKKAHVDIVIDPSKVTLQTGVQAQLVLYSIAAGTMAIELSGGDPEADQLPADSQIPEKASTFAAISGQMEGIMEDVKGIADKLNKGLEGMEPGRIASTVNHADEALAESKDFIADGRKLISETTTTVTEVREEAKTAVEKLSGLSDDVRTLSRDATKLVNTTQQKIQSLNPGETQANLNDVLNELSTLTERLNGAVSQFDQMQENVSHDVDNVQYTMRSAIRELMDSFDDLDRLIEQVREDPASLIRGRAERKDSE